MYSNYVQGHLAKTHQWELQREAEQQRQAALIAPPRPMARDAISHLGWLLMRLGNWMQQRKQVEGSPKPITGQL